MTCVAKSLPRFKFYSPLWPTGLKVCPLLVLCFSFQSKALHHDVEAHISSSKIWLYLSATLNHSGCGKAPVVERRCVKISHCGFFSRKRSAPDALLRLADCLAFLFCCWLPPLPSKTYSCMNKKLFKLRRFDSMRVCQSPSVRSFVFMYFVFYSLPFLYSVGTRFCINGQLTTFWV